MAVATVPEEDTLGSIQKLLELIGGKPGSTVTTTSNLSDSDAQALVSSALGGPQGLAAVSSGQKSAGIYNSTTNRQLTNDLVAKISAEVAARKAGTTVTTANEAALSTKTLLAALAAMAAKSAMGGSGSGGGLGLGSGSGSNAKKKTEDTGESSPLEKIGNFLKDPVGGISELLGLDTISIGRGNIEDPFKAEVDTTPVDTSSIDDSAIMDAFNELPDLSTFGGGVEPSSTFQFDDSFWNDFASSYTPPATETSGYSADFSEG